MAEMDEVFKALADPSRRLLLDSLNARNGQSLRDLCAELSMARQSVSKHLAVLEAANLITTVWRGREKLHYLNAEPINAIADRWINQYERARVQTLADLKTALETEPMSSSEFVYTTYIRTTPEKLWQAITDPAFSNRYMGHAMVSDFKKGSTYAWADSGLEIAHPEQVILESDPYRGSRSPSTRSCPNSASWDSTRKPSPRRPPNDVRRCRSTSNRSTTTRSS